MAFFQKVPNLIPIDPDNVVSNDWIILLEANTIVDSSGELRVAKTTQALFEAPSWKYRFHRPPRDLPAEWSRQHKVLGLPTQ